MKTKVGIHSPCIDPFTCNSRSCPCTHSSPQAYYSNRPPPRPLYALRSANKHRVRTNSRRIPVCLLGRSVARQLVTKVTTGGQQRCCWLLRVTVNEGCCRLLLLLLLRVFSRSFVCSFVRSFVVVLSSLFLRRRRSAVVVGTVVVVVAFCIAEEGAAATTFFVLSCIISSSSSSSLLCALLLLVVFVGCLRVSGHSLHSQQWSPHLQIHRRVFVGCPLCRRTGIRRQSRWWVTVW